MKEVEDDGDKIVKLNISDIDGYMTQLPNLKQSGTRMRNETTQEEEELEHRLEEEIEGREAQMEEELDLVNTSSTTILLNKETGFLTDQRKNLKTVVASVANTSLASIKTSDLSTGHGVHEQINTSSLFTSFSLPCQPEPANTFTLEASSPRSSAASNIRSKIISIEAPKEEILCQESSAINKNEQSIQATTNNNPVLKIQYKQYNSKVLWNELGDLFNKTELCDTELLCKDGKVIKLMKIKK